MGGGDLNLKKSWHPQTMRNQEKVWKAEQAEIAEKRRLDELRKEIAEEKTREDLKKIGQTSGVLTQNDNPKLEWMYKGPAQLLNREDYLLGRTIDKNFEQLDAEEKAEKDKQIIGVTVPKNHVEHECIPFSIRQYRSVQSKEQVDLQRKIMEDPLMLIKQKELETRKKILENPVKLKELHRLLKSEKDTKFETKKKSKKEKKKKEKKKKSKRSSADTSDEELDKMLAKQYKKIQDAFGKADDAGKLDINKLLNVKYEKLTKELDSAAKSKKRDRKISSSSESKSSDSEKNNDYHKKDIKRQTKGETSRNYRRSSRDEDRSYKRKERRSRSRGTDPYRSNQKPERRYSPEKRRRSPIASERKKSETITRETQRSRNSNERSGQSRDRNAPQSQKLSEEEKEKRRLEMMQNAVWRDEERTRTVKKYREEYDKEREQHERNEFDKTFINKELQKAMSNQKSVESRIKSNINNIQRSSRAMDTNFARR